MAQCGPGGLDSRGPGPAADPEDGGPQSPLPPLLHRRAALCLRRVRATQTSSTFPLHLEGLVPSIHFIVFGLTYCHFPRTPHPPPPRQPVAAARHGSVQLHRPHRCSGEHHLQLQAPGEPELGGFAALRHRRQVLETRVTFAAH